MEIDKKGEDSIVDGWVFEVLFVFVEWGMEN